VVRLATKNRDGSFYRTNYCTWRPKTVLAWSKQINHNNGRQITTTRNIFRKFTIYYKLQKPISDSTRNFKLQKSISGHIGNSRSKDAILRVHTLVAVTIT
jgi:hypothetical protein